MRNVTIVVAVLITSCQVSENPKIGPVMPQTRIATTATRNAQGEPTAVAVAAESLRNFSRIPLLDARPLSRGVFPEVRPTGRFDSIFAFYMDFQSIAVAEI